METLKELYPECTSAVDGFDGPPGIVYTFVERDRAYRFDVPQGSAYASSLRSTFDGREVTIALNKPYASGSPVIQIPTSCAMFQSALAELQRIGISHIGFFNQPTGSFKHVELQELRDA